MINDIEFPEVKNVTIAVVKEDREESAWKVYLINKNQFPIENTLVSSKGYGEKEGEKQKTSVLRHFLQTIPANKSALIEPIDPAVFHLNNEYWVSYYVGEEIYDKRFLFVPDAIREENMTFIKELDKEGILHS
ncbi:MAG TPA: hypothetical protein DIW27_05805 [Cytophagales bacterium]|nr:hypothetical protein [Cytophagales bacterium]